MWSAHGAFELKEHFVAVGLGMLPAYWDFWRQPLAANYTAALARNHLDSRVHRLVEFLRGPYIEQYQRIWIMTLPHSSGTFAIVFVGVYAVVYVIASRE